MKSRMAGIIQPVSFVLSPTLLVRTSESDETCLFWNTKNKFIDEEIRDL